MKYEYGYVLKLTPNEKGTLTAALNDYLKELESFKKYSEDEVIKEITETTNDILKQLKNLEPSLFIEEKE